MALLKRATTASGGPAPQGPPHTAAVVALNSVVSLAGRYPLLAGASLTIDSAQVVVVTGANGAGKTSLLRLIAGLLPVHEGKAAVFGHDLSDDPRLVRRLVGFAGHQPFLYDDLTVGENLAFVTRARGRGKLDLAQVLALTGLGASMADRRAGRLSAGQRRRVGLAALFAGDSKLWLLDEPHSGLDQDTRVVLNNAIRAARQRGVTVILTSHEPAAVADLAERRVSVEGGTVMDDRVS